MTSQVSWSVYVYDDEMCTQYVTLLYLCIYVADEEMDDSNDNGSDDEEKPRRWNGLASALNKGIVRNNQASDACSSGKTL